MFIFPSKLRRLLRSMNRRPWCFYSLHPQWHSEEKVQQKHLHIDDLLDLNYLSASLQWRSMRILTNLLIYKSGGSVWISHNLHIPSCSSDASFYSFWYSLYQSINTNYNFIQLPALKDGSHGRKENPSDEDNLFVQRAYFLLRRKRREVDGGIRSSG